MTFRRLFLVAGMTGMTAVIASCGNYSNEDLLYMSGVPSSSQLAVVLPAAATTVMQAELAQDTHNGISNVNTLLDDVLGLVDTIRSYEPTSRTSDSRTWGPFDDSNHPGWQWKLVVNRADTTSFNYHLDVQSTAAAIGPGVSDRELRPGGRCQAGERRGDGLLRRRRDRRISHRPQHGAVRHALAHLSELPDPGSPVSAMLTLIRTVPDKNGVMSVSFSYKILTDGRARSPSCWPATSWGGRGPRW